MIRGLEVLALPKEEHPYASHINANLRSIEALCDTFRNCVDLYLFAERQVAEAMSNIEKMRERADDIQVLRGWGMIGAGHGAIQVQGVYMAMQAISKDLLWKSPTVLELLDHSKKNDAYRIFEASFPGIAKVRVDAAHPGELGATPEKAQKNAAPGLMAQGIRVGMNALFSGSIIEGAYTATVDGRVVSYRPNAEAVKSLYAVATAFIGAFEPAIRRTNEILR